MILRNEKELDISVVMPCLDERGTVGQCVDEAFSFIKSHKLNGEIIIVDNDSRDGSAKIASQHGAIVIPEMHRGYGRAIRAGIEESRGAVIVIADCDMTYDLAHIGGIFLPLSDGRCDMVIGNRFSGGIEPGAMPPLHRLGVPFLSWCGRMRYGTSVRDFHCGLRGMTRETAQKLDFVTDGMEFSTEMIARASECGLRIGQVPVRLRKCNVPRKSKLKTFSDGFRHFRFIIH